MREYTKIPVTQEMVADLNQCDEAIDAGESMDCKRCSLFHGEYGCLDKYAWLLDDSEHPASSGGRVFVPVEQEGWTGIVRRKIENI